ncbi:hypothetical protein E2C01_067163 [Portunus trituberculatus]|uniref:Uncharacterized protein n=1 Tax=Portunus trituberculatus TaxID=210409 RepID=A0A5B7HSV3_PORTR|nr:hypothetical protein [Portunus trituberculatus]
MHNSRPDIANDVNSRRQPWTMQGINCRSVDDLFGFPCAFPSSRSPFFLPETRTRGTAGWSFLRCCLDVLFLMSSTRFPEIPQLPYRADYREAPIAQFICDLFRSRCK